MNRHPRLRGGAGIAKRKTFQKPSMHLRHTALKKIPLLDAQVVLTTPSKTNLHPNRQKLNRVAFNMITSFSDKGIHYHVSQVYIQQVCEFINDIHGRHTPGTIPVCATLPADLFRRYYNNELHGHNNDDAFAELLQSGLHPANFMQLLHLFMLDRSRPGHISLIVISPLAHTVDILDSHVPHDELRRVEDQKPGIIFRLLARRCRPALRMARPSGPLPAPGKHK
jgi:hypothetical protein